MLQFANVLKNICIYNFITLYQAVIYHLCMFCYLRTMYSLYFTFTLVTRFFFHVYFLRIWPSQCNVNIKNAQIMLLRPPNRRKAISRESTDEQAMDEFSREWSICFRNISWKGLVVHKQCNIHTGKLLR